MSATMDLRTGKTRTARCQYNGRLKRKMIMFTIDKEFEVRWNETFFSGEIYGDSLTMAREARFKPFFIWKKEENKYI